MTINGINGTNAQMGQMGMNQATDSYSRNIQNQIADVQKQLQELSSNKDMTQEEKMTKRQELQQQISDLNMQLRQHQAEQRREKQQKQSSFDDMLGGSKSAGAGTKSTGMSQASMTAMISADTSLKQAKVQGSVATQMEGKAGVLESEIKMDKCRGASTEKKEEELADLQAKAQVATASQMSTLAEANKVASEAAAVESTEKKDSDAKEGKAAQAGGKTEKTADSGAKGEKVQDGISGTDAQTGNIENVQQDNGAQNIQPAETAAPEAPAAQAAVYTHVDVRL